MVYNFKEYKPVFDTPMKRQQELVISRKIMDLLNKNKYDDLEEFITKNPNYQDFLKKNDMQTVIKHFGNTLKEEDYIRPLAFNSKGAEILKQIKNKSNIEIITKLPKRIENSKLLLDVLATKAYSILNPSISPMSDYYKSPIFLK